MTEKLTVSLRRIREGAASCAYAFGALAGCVAAGYVFALGAAPIRGSKMLPWLAGRSLGLAAYVSLSALTLIGLWIRHPWRFRWPLLHPEVRLRVHAALAAATVLIVALHVVVLASDRYAGVGWYGAFVPGASAYRTSAVAIGVAAVYAMLLISVTAALAGRLGGGSWLGIHRLAVPTWAAAWLHGVLAGTDTAALRVVYATTGVIVLGVVVGRFESTNQNKTAALSRTAPATQDRQ